MMAERQDEPNEPTKKSRVLPVFMGLFATLVGAGGAFLAVQNGVLPITESATTKTQTPGVQPLPDVVFVAIEPMTITLRGRQASKHLRFSAQLEVYAPHSREVAQFLPRIQDVLNTYLRSVRVSDFEDSIALYRIRSHVLHRVNLVVGEGRVRDVLITEFIMT